MDTSFFYRWALILGMILGQFLSVSAQNKDFDRAQKVYEQFVSGQGDSIYSELTKELQQKLSPGMFNDTFRQAKAQVGNLQSKGEWIVDISQGAPLYYCDLEFERYNLRFLVAFSEDGLISRIRLMPVPVAPVVESSDYDKTIIKERDIMVGTDGFKLPGTLTLPLKQINVPVVILVQGSGPNDRDETIGPNKPFRDIAWGLAEQGIAVIRYDKRTKVYGANFVPKGRVADYDTEVVDDAVAAVTYAKTLPEINKERIYVLGHSLGGTLVPRIASHADGVAGVIIVAGLARALEDAVVEQVTNLSALSDSSAVAKEKVLEIRKEADNVKRIGTVGFDGKILALLNLPVSYWKFANEYKPVNVASKLTLPILILQGERDYQVTMEDFSLWRTGLRHNKNVFFKSYSKLNHLLQEGSGKSIPEEYMKASSVPDYVLSDIAAFIQKRHL